MFSRHTDLWLFAYVVNGRVRVYVADFHIAEKLISRLYVTLPRRLSLTTFSQFLSVFFPQKNVHFICLNRSNWSTISWLKDFDLYIWLINQLYHVIDLCHATYCCNCPCDHLSQRLPACCIQFSHFFFRASGCSYDCVLQYN